MPYPTKGDLGSTQVKALSAYQLMVKTPQQANFVSAGEFDVTLAQVHRAQVHRKTATESEVGQ